MKASRRRCLERLQATDTICWRKLSSRCHPERKRRISRITLRRCAAVNQRMAYICREILHCVQNDGHRGVHAPASFTANQTRNSPRHCKLHSLSKPHAVILSESEGSRELLCGIGLPQTLRFLVFICKSKLKIRPCIGTRYRKHNGRPHRVAPTELGICSAFCGTAKTMLCDLWTIRTQRW